MDSILEFGIDGASKYITRKVQIDRSSAFLADLSNDRNPTFTEEQVFLKVLVEGERNLYEYVDGNLIRFFYSKDSVVQQLIFKTYRSVDGKIGQNNTFRQQLLNDFKCPAFSTKKFETLGYNRKDLARFFGEYSACHNVMPVDFKPKQKRDFFNLSLRPRFNVSTLQIQNADGYNDQVDFGSRVGFGFGVELEFVLPYNKNKWSFILEPTAQRFESVNNKKVNNVYGGVLVSKVDYSSLEIPVGVRYYSFLGDKSKVFFNAAVIFDFASKSLITFDRADGSNARSDLKIQSRNNLAFGVGYKYANRLGVEVRYQAPREILNDYLKWSSEFTTFSVVVGYSLF
ncbi:porin family protein [Pseudochryseolinea flava]|nr:porin family protein [Pseudochryseolinea flava]